MHQRPQLLRLAYPILGSVSDAEDVVQDVWLRLLRVDVTALERPEAWLSTAVTRLSLDRLRRQAARRESYPGPWLPEPWSVTSPEAAVEQAETLSLALLAVMETLTPAERVAFVLHDVLAHEYGEIAVALNRSPAACRQLVSRARRRLGASGASDPQPASVGQQLLEAFLAACQGNAVQPLLDLLHPEVVLTSDGGGRSSAARRPVHGPDRVGRFLLGLRGRGRFELRPAAVNGGPGATLHSATSDRLRTPFAGVLALNARDDRTSRVDIIVNPDKLRHLHQA